MIKHNIVNILETIKIELGDYLFEKLAVILVFWIDPKYIEDFEKKLIILLSLFGILNNYFIYVFIFFFKESFHGCAHNN